MFNFKKVKVFTSSFFSITEVLYNFGDNALKRTSFAIVIEHKLLLIVKNY